jgi:hypothetical protein
MGGGRKSQKKKKVRAPGRPARTGRKTGCGTGSGGFGEGNDCAKEDGIPNRPLSAGGALKMPNVKQLKKEVAQEKAAAAVAAEKQRRKDIQAKKKAAVARKEAKDQKDSADKQAADAARAKKRAEMLQKIRIKKANEKLAIDGKDFGIPRSEKDSAFSGASDQTLKKMSGETEFEFQSRRAKADLDLFHKRADAIDAKSKETETRLHAAWKDLDEKCDRAIAASGGDAAAVSGRQLEKMRDDARAALNKHRADTAAQHHALVAEFTAAHGGGASQIPTDVSSHNVITKKYRKGTQKWLEDVWSFLGRVASKKHASQIMKQKIVIKAGGRGSASDNNEIKVTAGSRTTTVHEYGHAIENGRESTMRALEEDYNKRLSAFFAANPSAGLVTHRQVSYYEGPELPTADGKKPPRNGSRSSKSLLGYARRYSDFGYNAATIAEYKSARYSRGSEVFSTGIEALYENPAAFRSEETRQHFNLTLLILAGRI